MAQEQTKDKVSKFSKKAFQFRGNRETKEGILDWNFILRSCLWSMENSHGEILEKQIFLNPMAKTAGSKGEKRQ